METAQAGCHEHEGRYCARAGARQHEPTIRRSAVLYCDTERVERWKWLRRDPDASEAHPGPQEKLRVTQRFGVLVGRNYAHRRRLSVAAWTRRTAPAPTATGHGRGPRHRIPVRAARSSGCLKIRMSTSAGDLLYIADVELPSANGIRTTRPRALDSLAAEDSRGRPSAPFTRNRLKPTTIVSGLSRRIPTLNISAARTSVVPSGLLDATSLEVATDRSELRQ